MKIEKTICDVTGETLDTKSTGNANSAYTVSALLRYDPMTFIPQGYYLDLSGAGAVKLLQAVFNELNLRCPRDLEAVINTICPNVVKRSAL